MGKTRKPKRVLKPRGQQGQKGGQNPSKPGQKNAHDNHRFIALEAALPANVVDRDAGYTVYELGKAIDWSAVFATPAPTFLKSAQQEQLKQIANTTIRARKLLLMVGPGQSGQAYNTLEDGYTDGQSRVFPDRSISSLIQ